MTLKTEVLSPAKSKLESIKQQIISEWGPYYEMERDAARRAVKMGLLLLTAKHTLPTGEFMGWCVANIPIVHRQINRFMKLAEMFLQHQQLQKQDVLLLTEGGKGKANLPAKKMEQLLLDFVGDKSQAELFAFYGVTKGGAAEKPKHQTPEHLKTYYRNQFANVVKHADELTRGGADTDMKWLEPNEIVACYTKLEEFAARLRLEIKRRQAKK